MRGSRTQALTLVVVPVLYSYLVRERTSVTQGTVTAGGAAPCHMPAAKE